PHASCLGDRHDLAQAAVRTIAHANRRHPPGAQRLQHGIDAVDDHRPRSGVPSPPCQTRVSSATACAAIDSPAPIESAPSFVFPLTLTCGLSLPIASASRARMASTYGAIFGRSAITTTSTFTTA